MTLRINACCFKPLNVWYCYGSDNKLVNLLSARPSELDLQDQARGPETPGPILGLHTSLGFWRMFLMYPHPWPDPSTILWIDYPVIEYPVLLLTHYFQTCIQTKVQLIAIAEAEAMSLPPKASLSSPQSGKKLHYFLKLSRKGYSTPSLSEMTFPNV